MLRKFQITTMVLLALCFLTLFNTSCTEEMAKEMEKEIQEATEEAVNEAKEEAKNALAEWWDAQKEAAAEKTDEIKNGIADWFNSIGEGIKGSWNDFWEGIFGGGDSNDDGDSNGDDSEELEPPDEEAPSESITILTANVGNADCLTTPLLDYIPDCPTAIPLASAYKLQPNSDTETLVKSAVERLRPDICIFIESWGRTQVQKLLSDTGYNYYITEGCFDFFCIREDLLARDSSGRKRIYPCSDADDLDLGEDLGLKTSFVDFVLAESNLPVRVIFAHFVSPLASDWEAKQIQNIDWIIQSADIDIPVIVAGDFNNDFCSESYDIDMEASIYINNELERSALRNICNPKDSNEKCDYTSTHKFAGGLDELTFGYNGTYDWVIGNSYTQKASGYQSGFDLKFSYDWGLDHRALYGELVLTGFGSNNGQIPSYLQ